MLFLDECKLANHLLKTHQEREFHILDIGAGNFQLVDHLAKSLLVPEGIQVHIYGLRGEQYHKDQNEQTGPITIHKIGRFKIEETNSELKKRGFTLANRVDLIFSRHTFIHLCDPVGTFQTTYNLLRPGKGIMLVDTINYAIPKEGLPDGEIFDLESASQRMLRLALATGGKFLYHFRQHRIYDHMLIIQRSGSTLPLRLRLNYHTPALAAYPTPLEKKVFPLFETRKGFPPAPTQKLSLQVRTFTGDKELFDTVLGKEQENISGIYRGHIIHHPLEKETTKERFSWKLLAAGSLLFFAAVLVPYRVHKKSCV
ncbi:MAG: class I SAM-dependent methyltransferase [Simkaniaceae bacterium]|nr:class I SAM-dependent methyltransferase [Simkaniaceae bacterium]